MKFMKAIVWTKYGSPEGLQLQEAEKPMPKSNEVLIKIHATTVTTGDCEMRRLDLPFSFGPIVRLFNGVRRPKRITILGQELAGEIEAIGKDVTLFKEGDEVFASTDFFMGGYAQYKCLPENGIVALKPKNMTFDEAASVPLGGLNALHFLRKGKIKEGHRVLINGSGGSIGTMAVQLAKHYGAEVTAVDSGPKLEMLRSLGSDYVIDYTREDFTRRRETYDIIIDVVGAASISRSIKLLAEDGTFVLGNLTIAKIVGGMWNSWRSGRKLERETADYTSEDLNYLRDLIEAGTIRTAIDRRYSMEEIVQAHRYVETGQKIGNVVVTVDHV
jgi:2-desacetyl-2-hydroxyethyl bacteriochlorophyllide A dehydrogenase